MEARATDLRIRRSPLADTKGAEHAMSFLP
jgi:hypothetical protein